MIAHALCKRKLRLSSEAGEAGEADSGKGVKLLVLDEFPELGIELGWELGMDVSVGADDVDGTEEGCELGFDEGWELGSDDGARVATAPPFSAFVPFSAFAPTEVTKVGMASGTRNCLASSA